MNQPDSTDLMLAGITCVALITYINKVAPQAVGDIKILQDAENVLGAWEEELRK